MNQRIDSLVRDNIRTLTPYSSARTEFGGAGEIYLDANENRIGSTTTRDFARYPDPLQTELRKRLSEIHDVTSSEVFVGNGSDEAIDLLIRIFCRPQHDSIIVCPPTYGMYEVAAAVNDVNVIRIPLRTDFSFDSDAVIRCATQQTKILFLCSPNNPTGNVLDRAAMLDVIKAFPGIVLVDEAYVEFSQAESLVKEIGSFDNLVILRTFSKAWGLAGLRVGYAIAARPIVDYMLRVKPPYNVNTASQELAIDALANRARSDAALASIVRERESLSVRLSQFTFVERVYPSAANFLLVKMTDASGLYRFLLSHRIVVRDRSRIEGCEGCLRITVGTSAENERLLEVMTSYEESLVYRS